jgi:hypothetical protein
VTEEKHGETFEPVIPAFEGPFSSAITSAFAVRKRKT